MSNLAFQVMDTITLEASVLALKCQLVCCVGTLVFLWDLSFALKVLKQFSYPCHQLLKLRLSVTRMSVDNSMTVESNTYFARLQQVH